MNTSFKILWFEDEPTWYKMEEMRVKEILSKHSLKPVIIRKNGDDFALEEITGNEYDLILIDYMLADETTGDLIVSALREHSILTDVLFYSSEEQKMLDAIRSKMPPIDGVYLTKRDYTVFTEKVDKLISKIVKRSEDIVNLRGFVMDGSSDFELRIKEILNIAWNKLSESEMQVLEDAVEKRLKTMDKRWEGLKTSVAGQKPIFPAAVNTKYFFSNSDRLYLLQIMIGILQKNYGLREDAVLNKFKSSYENSISSYRNALGHKKETDNHISIQGKTIAIDEALHQTMRIRLQEYDNYIKELELFVTTKM